MEILVVLGVFGQKKQSQFSAGRKITQPMNLLKIGSPGKLVLSPDNHSAFIKNQICHQTHHHQLQRANRDLFCLYSDFRFKKYNLKSMVIYVYR